jgi:16S rRNA (guanine966-N2)-methyltransferase
MRIIAGEARGRKLFGPRNRSTRPPLDRIRESVFSILADTLGGRQVLDLFAGVGAFGLEAISRGAARAAFVERDRTAITLLERNIESLGFGPRSEIVKGDALRLPDLSLVPPSGFGLVFLDPPFKMFQDREGAGRVLERLEEILASPALEPHGMVVMRQPARYREPSHLPVRERRTYSESVVLFLSREPVHLPFHS